MTPAEKQQFRASVFQNMAAAHTKAALDLRANWLPSFMAGALERMIVRIGIEQEAAALFSALARAAMGIDDAPALKLIRAGQIEAFEFAARQFRVYASDNQTLAQRYRLKGKDFLISDKRTQTWNDAADDCERVAAELRRDVDG